MTISPASAAEKLAGFAEAVYLYSVAQHCGLLTPRAEAGYSAEERRLISNENLDPGGAMRARIAGGIAFAQEYQNRGLGGTRPWCRTEGAAAVKRFESAPLD